MGSNFSDSRPTLFCHSPWIEAGKFGETIYMLLEAPWRELLVLLALVRKGPVLSSINRGTK